MLSDRSRSSTRVFASSPSPGETLPRARGSLGELAGLGIRVETPDALKDVPGRVHTVRLLFGGKEVQGKVVRYVCANSSPGLLWFAECLEQASWPPIARAKWSAAHRSGQ